MRHRDPVYVFIFIVVLIIINYGKIEGFFERIIPIKVSQIWVKILAHTVVSSLIGCLSILYYFFTRNPSMLVIFAAIAVGFIVRYIINEISKLLFNENYD